MTKAYQHQLQGIDFAVKNNGNCALLWAPGTGKTFTSIAIYKELRAATPSLRLLVVCPLSLVRATWMADTERFTTYTAAPYRDIKPGEAPDVVIINYESLISKRVLPGVVAMLRSGPWMCVLDESSRLKSNKSLTTKTLLQLAPLFRHRMILSGTPMPNSELELWAQLRFVRPDSVDKSFYQFRNAYFTLTRNGQTMPTQGGFMTRSMMSEIMRKGWKYTISQEAREKLMTTIKPYTFWMRKEDALDLPEQVDQVREVTLSGPERDAYETMKRHLVVELAGQEIAAPVMLAKIMKLRQLTSGFAYNCDGAALPVGESKLRELEDTIEQAGDQPVLIFAEFHHEIEQVRAMLAKRYGDDSVATLYVGTDDRDDSIVRFQSGRARYLVAHPKSAAHGLTFVNCSTTVFYALDYSWEMHEQARNRIHRIGQTKSCTYIYLIAKDTIDEQLLAVLSKKQSLQDAVHEIINGKNGRKVVTNDRNAAQAPRTADDKAGLSAGVCLQSR